MIVANNKLDGVGPVDSRPSTNKLHHLIHKKNKKYTWHVTCDTWHLTCDTWHVTHDIQGVINILSQFQVPSSYNLGIMMSCELWHVTCDTGHMTRDMWHRTGGGRWTFSQTFSSLALTVWEWRCSEDISTKDESINEIMTKVFVEQPRLHRVC